MVLQPLYTQPQRNLTTYAALVSHRHVFYTIKGKKKSRLVPELGQMFEINGNFLVFFELGQMRGGGGKAEFLYRMSSGCSAITLTGAPALVSPHWTETDIVFHCSVLFQSLGGCRWAQCWDFIVVEHGGSGSLGQISLQAWTAGGGDVPTSSSGSGTTVSSLHSFFPLLSRTCYCSFISELSRHTLITSRFKGPVLCWTVGCCPASQQRARELLKRGALLLTLRGKRVKQMTAYSGW